jgi:hypothetical protein
MKRVITISLAVLTVAAVSGTGLAEIKKARIPDTSFTPNLRSVMKHKDKGEKKKQEINTNGQILKDRNIVVDDIEDPKCVFYGNYNNGSGDAEQYFDIDTIVFECE